MLSVTRRPWPHRCEVPGCSESWRRRKSGRRGRRKRRRMAASAREQSRRAFTGEQRRRNVGLRSRSPVQWDACTAVEVPAVPCGAPPGRTGAGCAPSRAPRAARSDGAPGSPADGATAAKTRRLAVPRRSQRHATALSSAGQRRPGARTARDDAGRVSAASPAPPWPKACSARSRAAIASPVMRKAVLIRESNPVRAY